MLGRLLVAVATLSLGLLACKSTVNGDGTSSGSGTSTGGASSQQLDSCHQDCDQMKFFGCNSADEQASCYSDCSSATPTQIEAFDGCAKTSICDPECRNDIVPKPASGPIVGTGATPASCTTACQKLVSCSFIKLGDQSACVTDCGSEAYQYQIDCINNTACAQIQTACGGGGGSVDIDASIPDIDGGGTDPSVAASINRCQNDCDLLLEQSCFAAADQSTCRAKCAASATTSGQRDTFSSCTEESAGCTDEIACYSAF